MRIDIIAVLLLLSIASPFSSFAQKKSPLFLYLEGGFGGGIANEGNIGLNCLFARHHQIGLGYTTFSHKAKTPPDYNGSGIIGTTIPTEYEDGLSICYSYVLYPADQRINDRLRYALTVGLLFGTYSIPANFHKTGSWFGPNYDYDDIAQPTTAFIFRAGVTYTPSRAFGLGSGIYATIGRLSGAGVWGSMSLGKVGSHKRHRHKDKHQTD